MQLRVNDKSIDTKFLRCSRTNRDASRCQHYAGDKSIVEIVTDNAGNVKLDVTCGTHVNTCAGDDVRYRVRLDALDNATVIRS